jgi:hypothetical protein
LGATRACRLEEHQLTGADGCRSPLAMVALWKRAQEILATKAEQKWEEEGGRRREFLDLAVELHELLDRRLWEVDVFYVDAMKPSDEARRPRGVR